LAKKSPRTPRAAIVPDLPPALASCAPYYERVRLHLRRFLVYLRPWDAQRPADGVSPELAGGPGEDPDIDDYVIRVLVGEGYTTERAGTLAAVSEALEAPPPRAVAEAEDPGGRFAALRERVGLDRWEVDLLWVLLLPELVPEFLWLYRAIWGDTGRVAAPEDFLLHVPDPYGHHQAEVRRALGAEGILSRLLLVETVDVGFSGGQRHFRASGRLVDHLLGGGAPGGDLAALCRPVPDRVPLDELAVPAGMGRRLVALLGEALGGAGWREGGGGPPAAFHLYGPRLVGKRSLCAAAAGRHGRGVLALDLRAWAEGDDASLAALLPARREAFLRGDLLLLRGVDALEAERPGVGRARRDLAVFLAGEAEPVFLTSAERSPVVDGLVRAATPLELRTPGHEVREGLWRRVLGGLQVKGASDIEPRELARKYNLPPGRIEAAAEEAVALARLRGGRRIVVSHADLVEATTAQLTHDLTLVADRVEKTMDWDDLILPDKCLEVLEEIVLRHEHSSRVMDGWGFREKFAYGTGISVLFSGPPGTGKTMTAGIMARELDMELFRVDLSRVVSKWIGETEKNLARVFDEAKASHAIILFDEADSLFGRRGEVRSSVDRYSNLEVNYLLQRMEAYEGISILTTNQQQSMDDAFMRRLTFKVYFPFPDVPTRERLWQSMLPKQARVAKDIRWRELARSFEFTGGHIKNAVLRAAFLAMERDEAIGHRLLVLAARDEARGMGRLLREDGLEEEERA